MRFSILGPLVAETDDGTPLAVPRLSQRATLAVLLLHAAQPMTKSMLIEALWGDSPPAAADAALRVRIRDARRALADTSRIQTRSSGYQIVVAPGELDADIFPGLVERGRTALDSGNPEHAARLLDQACRLWREPPLVDVPDTPLAQTAVMALLARWREAREWLIDARLALGQQRELLSEIRAVIATEPLAEHPHVQLMLALYRSGQKVAALDAYSRLRELTTREFGQDPGPEAREMLRQILSDDPALNLQPRLAVAAGTSQLTGWLPLCQLPAPPPDFTGRVAVLEVLARRMPPAPLSAVALSSVPLSSVPLPAASLPAASLHAVSLSAARLSAGSTSAARAPASSMAVTVLAGPPGVGTTALAVHAAHLAAAGFPDGQLFVDLGGRFNAKDPGQVLAELLRSLGIPDASIPAAIAERAALYRSMLAGRRVLVLADDAATAAQVRPLLPGTRGSAVLITSHSRLADLEGARCIEVGPLSQDEAIAMLGKVAGRELRGSETGAWAAIAAACGGLPLALRIAGARLAADRGLRPAALAAALAVPGKVLAELVVGDLSVARRLAVAWQMLEPDAQHALWLLAHTRQPYSPSWLVQAVTGGSHGAVLALADSCLVLPDPVRDRYSLAPLVGVFALGQASPWSAARLGPGAFADRHEYELSVSGR